MNAKISDFGMAKIVDHQVSRAPGALIYSAPEAHSSNYDTKVGLEAI